MTPTRRQPSALLVHGLQSSRNTWWRVGRDLEDLEWQVHTLDLLGHGNRSHAFPESPSLEALALDVAAQTSGTPVDVVVGHSLGALVALTLLALRPGYARAVIAEDPPGLGGGHSPRQVADDIADSVARARANPSAEIARLLTGNLLWASADAVNAVASRQTLNLAHVTDFLDHNRWDLATLVADCPCPVTLLAATEPGTALSEPDRTALLEQLPPQQVRVVTSGHSIHRDRPGMWVTAVHQLR